MALSILDGRNRHGNIQQSPVFSFADGFEMINALPPSEGCENTSLFFETVWRDDQSNMLANRFFGSVTKNSLCGFVPIDDDAVEILRDNGILRGFDDGSEATLYLLGSLALANVAVRFKD